MDITVTVTNANDAGSVEFTQRVPQVERALVAELSDPDGSVSGVTWQWSAVAPRLDRDVRHYRQ